jgi:hypothetical protein
MKSLQRHNSRLALVGALLGVLGIIGSAQAQSNVYPIAVSATVVSSVNAGDTILSIFNGAEHGNFGWLTWTGDNSEAALVTSLTGAGNVSAYTNPDDPNDHDLSVGDWVMGKLGASNSIDIRNALDNLEDTDIMVPVWDAVRGSGSSLAYHISGFARVHIEGYRLPGQNRISVTFLGVFDNPSGTGGGGDDGGGPGV